MNLTERLLAVALFGADWVLWLLIALSVTSVAVMIERLLFFRSTAVDFDALRDGLRSALAGKDLGRAREHAAKFAGSLEGDVVRAGLDKAEQGAAAASEAMVGAKSRGKLRLSRNLAFLGTLGNNAPFVGLFGTVIGVIKAFHDLAAKKGQGPEAVMGSLSEALIATAVGLLVAIPAVVAFNWFQGLQRQRIASTDALAHDVLAELADGSEGAQAKTSDKKKAAAAGEGK